jgi:hypothetical protein
VKRLNEIPVNDIKPGLRVRIPHAGKDGEVTEVQEVPGTDGEFVVHVRLDDGEEREVSDKWLEEIEVLEEPRAVSSSEAKRIADTNHERVERDTAVPGTDDEES